MTVAIVAVSKRGKTSLYCIPGYFLPDLQARRRKAKAKERAALEPTLARPSTPLLAGRGLKLQKKKKKNQSHRESSFQ